MFRPRVLNEIWITDLFLALVGMLLSSSTLFFFSRKVFLNSSVRLLLELYCVVAIKHVALLYYLGEINSGIHMYQFTFEHLHFCFGCGCGFGFEHGKCLADRGIWRKKFCSPNILFSDDFAKCDTGIEREKTQKRVNLQGYVSFFFQRTYNIG